METGFERIDHSQVNNNGQIGKERNKLPLRRPPHVFRDASAYAQPAPLSSTSDNRNCSLIHLLSSVSTTKVIGQAVFCIARTDEQLNVFAVAVEIC